MKKRLVWFLWSAFFVLLFALCVSAPYIPYGSPLYVLSVSNDFAAIYILTVLASMPILFILDGWINTSPVPQHIFSIILFTMPLIGILGFCGESNNNDQIQTPINAQIFIQQINAQTPYEQTSLGNNFPGDKRLIQFAENVRTGKIDSVELIAQVSQYVHKRKFPAKSMTSGWGEFLEYVRLNIILLFITGLYWGFAQILRIAAKYIRIHSRFKKETQEHV